MSSAAAPAAEPPYLPHPLLRNPHWMTVTCALLPRPAKALRSGEERLLIPVDSEHRILLQCNWQTAAAAPAAVFLHGLCGSAEAPYIRGSALKVWRRGFHTVRANLRNHGGTEHLGPGLTHAGHLDDLHAVVRWLGARLPAARFYLIGFSMGGNMVLKAAAAWGEQAPAALRGVVAVSPAVDLVATGTAMEGAWQNRIYTRYFLRRLRRMYRTKSRLWPERYPPGGMKGMRRLRDFDRAFTAPWFGFPRAEDLYAAAGAAPQAGCIRVPTRILHARDDPFVPAAPLTRPEFQGNPFLETILTASGGHVGFLAREPARSVDGTLDPDRFWAENRILSFLLQREVNAKTA